MIYFEGNNENSNDYDFFITIIITIDFFIIPPRFAIEKIEFLDSSQVKDLFLIKEYEIKENKMKKLIEEKTYLRPVLITIKFDNPYLFKSIYYIRGVIILNEKIKPIIVGEKIRMASEDIINMYSLYDKITENLNRSKFKICLLIDQKRYTNEDLEVLKSTEVRFKGFIASRDREIGEMKLEKKVIN